MKFNEIKIYTTTLGVEPLTNILLNHQIEGIVVEDSNDFAELINKKNSYDWDYIDESLKELENIETTVTFYLEDNEENKLILQEVKKDVEILKATEVDGTFAERLIPVDNESKASNVLGRLEIQETLVNDEDWKDNWKEYFKPAKISKKIVVKPTWEEYSKQSDEELIIEIDPGMAFGTGTHPTTSLCVKLLEKYITTGDSVLDVGCGSGILAMSAALLGVEEITAVEIDPVAVDVAKENVCLNQLEDKIKVMQGDLTKGLNLKVDIVVANLMADLVIMLSQDVAKHLKGRGIYISSGILIEKQKLVASAIEACGFEIIEIVEEDEWCAIAARLI